MAEEDGIEVNPVRLLRVTYAEGDGPTIEVIALACHYVAAHLPDGKRAIGIEIVFDPTIQPPHDLPTTSYRCPEDRFERRLLAPRDLKKITPVSRAKETDRAAE
jgi:hypothetical protein